MKALILSGGAGTRLRPLTHTSAKQLLPIANKPIIFYGIEAISSAGIKDFAIIVGDTAADVMKEVGDGSKFGVNITYIKQEAPLGLAHAVKISQDYMGDEPFIMYLGDNLLKEGIPEFAGKFNKNQPNALILLTKVPNPQQFGVAEIDASGKIVNLAEKPKQPKSDLALVGIYLFDKNIFKAVNAINPSARGELEITDAISWLLDNGYKVEHHEVTGWWKDTGKPDDLLEANQLILKDIRKSNFGSVDPGSKISGRVSVGKNSKIISSRIKGPAIIGDDCVIEDAKIGPFVSVGNGSVIEKSKVENSIIMEGVRIIGVKRKISGSILGKESSIVGVAIGSGPVQNNFIIGDRSEIVLG